MRDALIEELLARVALPAWRRRVVASSLAHYAAAACAAVVMADERGGDAVTVDPELVESLCRSVGGEFDWDRDAARAWLVRVMRAHGAVRPIRVV